MSTISKVLIIILNWNGLEDSIECLSSVVNQSYRNFDVMLVDNGSDKDEAKILKQKFGSKVMVVRNDKNLGFTRGHNKIFKSVLKKDKYDYIALLNNDATVDKVWLKRMVWCAKEENCDMVSCKMLQYPDKDNIDTLGFDILNTGDAVPLGRFSRIDKFDKRFVVWGPSGGGALYSTKMMKEVGIFDEYFDTGYEDSDYGMRATLMGYKCVFEPKAVMFHKGSVSINKIRNYKYVVKLQKNVLYTYFKLMPSLVIFFNLPFIILKYIGLVLFGFFTLKPKFSIIVIHAVLSFFAKDFRLTMEKRNKFKGLRKLGVIEVMKMQKFFVTYYVIYLLKFLFDKEIRRKLVG